MKYFEKYEMITEALSLNKVQVVILSNMDSNSTTVDSIKADCSKRGIPCHALDVKTAYLKEYVNKRNDIKIGDAETKPFSINRLNTVVMARRGVVTNTFTQKLLQDLEKANFFCVNSLDSTMTATGIRFRKDKQGIIPLIIKQYYDTKLTELGHEQSLQLGKTWKDKHNIELVLKYDGKTYENGLPDMKWSGGKVVN